MDKEIIQVFAENAYLIWLGLFIILIVIEILTVGLTTIWFAGGSLAAMLAAVLGAGAPMQIVLFLAGLMCPFDLYAPLGSKASQPETGKDKL